jgi:hypothetical protein
MVRLRKTALLALLWSVPMMSLAPSLDNPANRDFFLKDGNLLRREPLRSTVSQHTSCGCVTAFDVDGGRVAVIKSHGDKTTALELIDLASGQLLAEIPSPFTVPERSQKKLRDFDGVVSKILFDAGNSVIYLLLVDGATAWTLLRVDIQTRSTAWIASALNMYLVRSGQYRSNLVVLLNKLKLSPGRFLGYFLIDGTGKEIGFIGTTEAEVDDFALVHGAIP